MSANEQKESHKMPIGKNGLLVGSNASKKQKRIISEDRIQCLNFLSKRLKPTPSENIVSGTLDSLCKLCYGNIQYTKQVPIHLTGVIGRIADFGFVKQKLFIEIDGGYHIEKVQKSWDEWTDKLLIESGYQIIRFRNDEVASTDIIRKIIESLLKADKLRTNVRNILTDISEDLRYTSFYKLVSDMKGGYKKKRSIRKRQYPDQWNINQ